MTSQYWWVLTQWYWETLKSPEPSKEGHIIFSVAFNLVLLWGVSRSQPLLERLSSLPRHSWKRLISGPHLLEVLIHWMMTYILKPSDFQKAFQLLLRCSLVREPLLYFIGMNICIYKYISMYNKSITYIKACGTLKKGIHFCFLNFFSQDIVSLCCPVVLELAV